jgi:hypothetical protein
LSAGVADRWRTVGRSTSRSRAPEFDTPVDARRQEQIGKVNGALERVEVDTGDGCIVRFVDFTGVDSGFLAGTIKAIANVDAALFGSNPECTGLIVGKVEAGDRDFACLAVVSCMRELECFL